MTDDLRGGLPLRERDDYGDEAWRQGDLLGTRANANASAPRTWRSVELFAGAGGLGMAVARAGFSPLAVVEWDKFCCDTIRENRAGGMALVRDWPLTEGDVREFHFDTLPSGIELVTGGPPCQPFSIGGKHRGRQDERDMWPQAVRAVRELRPRAFVFENVKGLTRATFAAYFDYIRLQLTHPELTRVTGETWMAHLARLKQVVPNTDSLRYRVSTRVLNAADFGVPQKRERVFFVGFRSDLDVEWTFPERTHSYDALLWSMRTGEYWDRHGVPKKERVISEAATKRAAALRERPSALPWRTVRDAISDLPDPRSKAAATIPNHKFQDGARTYVGHTGSALDEPAKTLKAGDHGVPGGENMLRRSDGSVRYFTVRESARLQTFPDDYLFHGSWTETMRQLGNAVPVELGQRVVESVRRALESAGE